MIALTPDVRSEPNRNTLLANMILSLLGRAPSTLASKQSELNHLVWLAKETKRTRPFECNSEWNMLAHVYTLYGGDAEKSLKTALDHAWEAVKTTWQEEESEDEDENSV